MSYSKSNNNTKSLEQIIAESKAKNVNISASSNVKVVAAPTIKYPRFDLQPFGKDLTTKQVHDRLVKIAKPSFQKTGPNKGKIIVAPVLANVPGLTLPWDKKGFTYTPPNLRSPPDESMYRRLKVAGLNSYAAFSEKQFRSNGTKQGLVTRLSQQLVGPMQFKTTNWHINVMKEILPMRKISEEDFPTQMLMGQDCFKSMNTQASAGFPYAFEARAQQGIPKVSDMTYLKVEYRGKDPVSLNTESVPILEHAFQIAKKVWKIVDENQTIKDMLLQLDIFLNKYPELRTFMMKRKDEKMDREEFLTKVRPYGCQPLPMRLFCMWAMSLVEQNLENFIDNPSSISAYHFSQFYGGAKKILDHFYSQAKDKNKKFIGLSYGDDQLWLFVLKDGSVVWMTPDVRAMDMNTRSDTILSMSKWLLYACKNVPHVNYRAFVAALTLAFNHQVHVEGSFIYNKTESLFSGVPGTTVININNSARIHAFIHDVLAKDDKLLASKEKFFIDIGKILNYVRENTGYVFKGFEGIYVEAASLKFEDLCDRFKGTVHFDDLENIYIHGIPLPFLSNKIEIIEGKPICVPWNMDKLGASLVLPSAKSAKAGPKAQIERVIGVTFSGGWLDPKLYKMLKETFYDLRKQEKNHMGYDELPPGADLDVEEVLSKIGSFPSREMLYDMNTMSKADFAEKYFVKGVSASEPHDEEDEKPAARSGKDEDTGEYEVRSDFTHIIHEAAEELDEFNISLLTPETIPLAKAGNNNALTIEQEREKKEKKQIQYAKKKLREFVSAHFNGKVSRKAMDHIEEFEANVDDFYKQYVDDQYDETDVEYDEFKSLRKDIHDFIDSDQWQSWNDEYDQPVDDGRDDNIEEDLDELYIHDADNADEDFSI